MTTIEPQAPSTRRPGAVEGVAWLLAFRVVDRLAGMVSFLVLARLLLPEHFGVVALGTAVIAFIEVLTNLGLDTILIQVREPTREHYDTAWTIQAIVASACALLMCAAAYPAAEFFREPRLVAVIFFLALSLFIEGLQNIRLVDFRREMRFDREFVFLATRRLITIVVTIVAAWMLHSELALAIGILVSRTIGTGLSYWMRPYRPSLTLKLRKHFAAKSAWLLLSGVVVFVRTRSSDFVLGRMMGSASLGAYSLASDLSTMVTMELVVPINRVALSDLSAQHSREAMVARFDAVVGLVAVVLAPLALGLAACAHPAVLALFGEKWASAGDVLQILALANVVAALVSNIGVPIISLGYYRYNAVILGIGAGTLVPLLIVGVHYQGMVGAALAVLTGNAATALAALWFGRKAMDYGLSDFLRTVWRPLSAAIATAVLMRLAGDLLVGSQAGIGPWPQLAVMMLTGTITYPAMMLGLWAACGRPEGGERRALTLAAGLASRFGRRWARVA